jgi:pSer/pThr/pTyr-binding forkhead associated (FHA) protein
MDSLAKLIAAGPVTCSREIPLDAFPLRLGRGSDADVCVDDRWVSRDHCEIDLVDHALVVRDLNSKHGTYVNGCPIREAALKPGDLLNIGLSKFRVHYEHDAAPASVRDFATAQK